MTLKKNDLTELKKSGLPAINAKLHTLRQELVAKKLESSRQKNKNVALLRSLRRDLARLLTIRRELELSESSVNKESNQVPNTKN